MRNPATSNNAINALKMLSQTQLYFVDKLSQLCQEKEQPVKFSDVRWLRDAGLHGGGLRFEAPQNSLFNQGSVNVSQIQFEDTPEKALLSATALSTIIHPLNALIPSVHIHVSWTELRSGKHYWRVMADLNPAIACARDTQRFNNVLESMSGEYYQQATQQGDDYFYIPALQKHRGESHFYLEGFNPKDRNGQDFAQQFLTEIIDCYVAIFRDKINTENREQVAQHQRQQNQQRDYHTLYFYQVLTLDKGTTAGLLVHDQNDVGTLGSLPRFVNRNLLIEWAKKTPAPRDQLVNALVTTLAGGECCEVTATVKENIAQVIRTHYQRNPL